MLLENDYAEILEDDEPGARAWLEGPTDGAGVGGMVRFYQTRRGVLVEAEVFGLPDKGGKCGGGVYGFHIHEGGSCAGNSSDPFADAGSHFNPDGCKHPQHAGDLPPLFGNNGYAWCAVLTDRFTVREVVGRTVIVHAHPDDLMTQPAGNAGAKIACGVIRPA